MSGRSLRSSIRVRLTAAIAASTAAIASVAVLVGVTGLEARVRDDAIDRHVEELTGWEFTLEADGEDVATYVERLEAIGLVELKDNGLLVGTVDLDGDALAEAITFDDLSGLDEFDDVAEFDELADEDELAEFEIIKQLYSAEMLDEVAWAVVELHRFGLAETIYDEAADSDDNLHVLLASFDVAVLPRTGGQVGLVDLFDLDPETVLLPQSDVVELAAVSFEQFEYNQDDDEAAEDAPVEVGSDRQLEVVTEQFDGFTLGLIVDLTDELDALGSIVAPLWAAAAVLVILATAATWLLTGRALQPVADITRKVDGITSGTLHGRVPEPSTDDEIGVLARTMNRMLNRLEHADRQRRQFVSDASHELRTPVAVLRSEAEVAQKNPDASSVEQLSTVVLGESQRLERLVEDLLTLARSDEQPDGAEIAEVDLDELALAEATRSRRLPVNRTGVSAGRVRGRADDLSRVIGHLLDNAARHGESEVAVGVRTVSDTVELWVDDDGTGVPEADRSRVFDRFVRLDEARSRDRGGSGLGLAVVQEVVDRHGGTVEITDSPSGGARFLIRFPLEA